MSNELEYQHVSLVLAPDESESLKKFMIDFKIKDQGISQFVDKLVAYLGVKVVSNYLPANEAEYEQLKEENGKTLGLLVLDDFKPNQIKLICDEIIKQMDSKGLKNLANYPIDQSLLDEPLSYLYIRIAHKHVQEADNYDPNASYVDHEHIATWWRNNCDDAPNKVILCADSSFVINDTLEHIRKITVDDLRKALPNCCMSFIEDNYKSYGFKSYHAEDGKTKNLLMAALSVLIDDKAPFSAMLSLIAKYFIYAWYLYSDTECSMNVALGRALCVLNWPANAQLFANTQSNTKANVFKSFSANLKQYYKETSCFMLGKVDDKNPLNVENLLRNYKFYYFHHEDETGDKKPVFLEPYEHAFVKTYLDSFGKSKEEYNNAYFNLCLIDWEKLKYLFAEIKTKQKKETLLELTKRLFEEHSESEGDLLDAEQWDSIEPLLKGTGKNLDQEQRDELYEILKQKIHIFNQSSKVKNAWEKLIFSGQAHNDEDFILALAKAFINILPSQNNAELSVASVTLKLERSLKKLLDTNYYVGCYFSLRFGSFLREIFTRVNVGNQDQERFVLKYTPNQGRAKNNQESQTASLDYHPLINFANFFNAQQDAKPDLKRSSSKSKDATSYKFYLEPTFANDEVGKRCIIEWHFDVDNIGYYLFKDLENVLKNKCLQVGVFARNAFSVQGYEQALNLKDKSTFLPVQRLATGQLFNKQPSNLYNVSESFNKLCSKLSDIFKEQQGEELHYSQVESFKQDLVKIKESFSAFESTYLKVLQSLHDCKLNYDCVRLMTDQASIVSFNIMNASFAQEHSKIKNLTLALLECFNSVGMAFYEHYDPRYNSLLNEQKTINNTILSNSDACAIATPLAVSSLSNFVIKHKRMVDFIINAFNNAVLVNDRQLLKDSYEAELKLGDGNETIFINCKDSSSSNNILVSSQALNGYTLYESPESIKQDFAVSTSSSKGQARKKADSNKLNSKAYEDAALSFIERYIKARPYLSEQCTILIYYCGVVQLPLAIYKRLLEQKSLAAIKFHLIIVNCSVDDSAQIYKSFEDERLKLGPSNEYNSYDQRIKVSILADHVNQQDSSEKNGVISFDRTTSSSDGSFNHFLNRYSFKTNGNSSANNAALDKIADICLMFHVFDSQATFGFSNTSNAYLVENGLDNVKSLVSYADQDGVKSRYVGKFLSCPVLTDNEAIYLHGLYFLSQKDIVFFNKAKDSLAAISCKAKLKESDYALSLDLAPKGQNRQSIFVPLFELKTKDDENVGANLLDSVFKRCETVLFMDELMCRQLLNHNKIKIVYHQKLKDLDLNLLGACKEYSKQSAGFINNLLDKLDNNDEQKRTDLITRIVSDAADISGSIVIRSQLYRKRTYEMMGLVLCQYIVAQAFKVIAQRLDCTSPLGTASFVSLDDYAALIGQKEGKVADILGLQVLKYKSKAQVQTQAKLENSTTTNSGDFNSLDLLDNATLQANPLFVDCDLSAKDAQKSTAINEYVLVVYIIESKFFTGKEANALKKSKDQTRSSLEVFYEAIRDQNGNQILDRKIMLSKLANLLQYSSYKLDDDKAQEFAKIQQLISSEQIDILIKGTSFFYALNSRDISNKVSAGINVSIDPSMDKQREDKSIPITQLTITDHALKDVVNNFYAQDNKTSENSQSDSVVDYIFKQDQEDIFKRYLEVKSSEILHLAPNADQPGVPVHTQAPSGPQDQHTSNQGNGSGNEGGNGCDGSKGQADNETEAKAPASPVTSENGGLTTGSEETKEPSVSQENQTTSKGNGSGNASNQSGVKAPVAPENGELTSGSEETKEPSVSQENQTASQGNGNGRGNNETETETEAKAPAAPVTPENGGLVTSAEQVGKQSAESSVKAENNGSAQLATPAVKLPPKFEIHSPKQDDKQQQSASSNNEPLKIHEFWAEHPKVWKLIESSSQIFDDKEQLRLIEFENNEKALIQALKDKGIDPVLTKKKLNCNGAIFSFDGTGNFDLSKIKESDKQNFLTKYKVNIVELRPKPGEIDVYVKFKHRAFVSYLSLLKGHDFNFDFYEYDGETYRGFNSKFILGLGEETGTTVYLDLRKDSPHTLIGGSTGSGKSVCLNTILLDMVLTNLPNELEIILVDPKGGAEFFFFQNLPHLKKYGLITNQNEALEKLELLVGIMDERYQEFRSLMDFIKSQGHKVKNQINTIDDYNKICCQSQRGRLPHIFFIMDEFADWFCDDAFRKRANEYVNRLSSKARAAGIHLILATQRPDAKLMESSIKAQLENRICLKTTDSVNSKIILDDKDLDASKLSGKGHMICKLLTTSTAQGGYIDGGTVSDMIECIIEDYEDRRKVSN